MRTVTLVGGPEHGLQLEVQDKPGVIRLPMAPRRRKTHDITEYRRGWGDEYRWESMIEDANITIGVSESVLAKGGPKLRQMIRDEVRRAFHDMDPLAELDHRAIWRFKRTGDSLVQVTARMGPGRIPAGLHERSKRRGWLPR